MKRILFALLAAEMLISSACYTASADGGNSYEYVVDGTEYTVVFPTDNLSPEEQQRVAMKVIGMDGGVQTYNATCNTYGHNYGPVDYLYVYTHKLNKYHPRCLLDICSIQTCARCGYDLITNVSSNFVVCCPED